LKRWLKKSGGPFTDDKVHQADGKIDGGEEQRRFLKNCKREFVTLPKTDPIFKIQVTSPSHKRRDKTADGFGDSLRMYFTNKNKLPFENFNDNLSKIAICSRNVLELTHMKRPMNNSIYVNPITHAVSITFWVVTYSRDNF